MTHKKWLPGFTLCVVLIVVISQFKTTEPPKLLKDNNHLQTQLFTFGTVVDITFSEVEEQLALEAVDKLTLQLTTMNDRWHAWRPSELALLNRNLQAGDWFTPDEDMLILVTLAQRLSEQSNGYFNPAIGKLIDLWGFHRDQQSSTFSPPAYNEIYSLVSQLPTMSDITRNGNQLKGRNQQIQLDFGGFAKGYAVEQAVLLLLSIGINNAIVNAGGDLKVIGDAGGRPWSIAVKDPIDSSILGTIPANHNESIFTSGTYERNFSYQGKNFHHILDPRSGYPANDVVSATVISTDATLADAAATALVIAGPEEAKSIANNMGITEVLLVGTDNIIYLTNEMRDRITMSSSQSRQVQILE